METTYLANLVKMFQNVSNHSAAGVQVGSNSDDTRYNGNRGRQRKRKKNTFVN